MAADGAQQMCVECGDQEAALTCVACEEIFCRPCWQQQHRRGQRTHHRTTPLLGQMLPQPTGANASAEISVSTQVEAPVAAAAAAAAAAAPADGAAMQVDAAAASAHDLDDAVALEFANIPLRLSVEERGLLDVLQAALHVSEYTDVVDTIMRWDKEKRILGELDEHFNTVCGLSTCYNYRTGTQLVEKPLTQNEEFFQQIFEIGRRYKIMNPEKMRSTYGKMMYMLQDAIDRDIQDQIEIGVICPIKTVQSLLKDAKMTGMLRDPRLLVATEELETGHAPDAAQKKEAARAELCEQYAKDGLSAEDVMRVVYSISDAHAYVANATRPVKRMLHFLKTYFDPDQPGAKHGNLTLRWGTNGSKLDHSHATQFRFVLQSLTLWHRVMENMYYLWKCADADLLNDKSYYRLWNTGQGLNRVQSCPKVSGAMHSILSRVHSEVRQWVGLSVVHLGDRDVPNALVFIDKYTQVPRILGPIVQTIDSLEELATDPAIRRYFDNKFGGVDMLRMQILNDYFRHGFDGSGDDGGSCVDGRLTSTWNWCSKLEKKDFYPVFMLAGFAGFDGSWRAD